MKWQEKIDLDQHKVWFTADLHMFHSNILWMNKRPFKTVEEMNNYIIEMWNKQVNENDFVFVLGDFIWGSQATRVKALSDKLNGNICLVLGNHDKERMTFNKEGGNFKCLYSVARSELIHFYSKTNGTEQDIFMSHYPALSWPGKGRGTIHIHGHVHGALDEFNEQSPDLRVDVGLDAKLGYMKLISFDDLYEYMLHKAGDIPLDNYMNIIYNKNKDVIL